MTRTADQLALLRTETAPAVLKELQNIQAGHQTLATGVTEAISQGLNGIRADVRSALGRDQRELAQARQEIDDLRRELERAQAAWKSELDELRTAQQEAQPPTAAAAVEAEDVPTTEPSAAASPSTDAPAAQYVEETAVSDQNDPNPETSEQAATDMLTELTTVTGNTVTAHQPAPAPTAPAGTVPTTQELRASLEAALFDTLKTAARISTAELVCHPHAWQFIASCSATAEHFQLPPAANTDGKDDMTTVRLSGPSLMAAVNALFTTYWNASTSPNKNIQVSAMALAYYIDLSSAIRRTDFALTATHPDDRPLTRIVIDNRPAQTT
ncbi:chemotaxis protein histidine kinase CheA [Kitasatospora sp. MAA19]|uniref:hypothetical protein n=1 Tax=Kitasatospora sp. MAA19 TaxID=3035090 RepID=UPI002473B0C9|nr:hypothetical protein [Kitasatospora sp. MAA19]MDH6710904.1 chemotaxis protein histidine kinase CheA [Kitasatospora sp. MAA19]